MSRTGTGAERVATLTHIGIITKYNFLNYFRARRFYVMLGIVVIVGSIVTAVVAAYGPDRLGGTALAFYGAGWGSFASFLVILATAFFGGDAISGEFQNKTGYFLVPNPIRRSAIYVGKWLAALFASTIVLLVFAVFVMANGVWYYPGGIPSQFFESVLFAWIYLIAALSLTFAFSSLFKSTSISILMTVILLLFVFPTVVDVIIAIVANIEPWFSITYGAGIIANILKVPYPGHATPGGPFGGEGAGRFSFTTYNASVPEGLVILAVYFVVTAILGLWLFEKKEFTS
jgi:ABC-2 type transport system permease protein